jgi:uncharacterized membrane protein (DUF2068 family)
MLMRDTIGTTSGFDSSIDQSLPAFVSMSASSPMRKNIRAEGKHALMKRQDSGLLRLIAVFKLVKALTLIVVGIGALRLIHTNNAADTITRFAGKFSFNPGARYLDHFLAKIANLPPRDFRDLGIGSFVYAALFLTEGVGLWLAKRWAEWFTAIITGSLIPLEIFEIHRHPTVAKVIVLLLNIAIVAYLIVRIRSDSRA